MDYKSKLAELNKQMQSKYSSFVSKTPKPSYGLKGDEFDEIINFLEKRVNDEQHS